MKNMENIMWGGSHLGMINLAENVSKIGELIVLVGVMIAWKMDSLQIRNT